MCSSTVKIIGGGLAGCEAALRLSRAGVLVDLFEMKPVRFSPAHGSSDLAELVCSNSLRSDDPHSAVGLLKEEMRQLGSLIMEAAEMTRIPAGKALAVDRHGFSAFITKRLADMPGVRIIREEITELDSKAITVLATGPLTSEALSQDLARLVGREHLYFYDALAPIVTAESIDLTRAFFASRYKGEEEKDYLNCPLTEEEYNLFYEALLGAEKVVLREFEKPLFFEGCLPIEVMAERGAKTLTFGPMKPVGLIDPHTGRRPFAVVQLRKENDSGTLFNLVGFQTRMKRPEQEKVLRLIPGLEKAEFVRYGQVHRNTFINGPAHLSPFLSLTNHPHIFLGGQISGVEGYVESASMGILAGENAARAFLGRPLISPPPTTALGCLITHLTDQTKRDFQPSNVNFGLMPLAPKTVRKKDRPVFYSERALADLATWRAEVGL